MNRLVLVFILLGFCISSYSQEERFIPYYARDRLKISVQYAYFKGRSLTNVKPGKSAGVDVTYFFPHRLFVSAQFNYGTNRYFEDKLTNYTVTHTGGLPADDTNATLIINNIGLLGGLFIPVFDKLSITIQAGFSQYIEIKSKFPIKVADSDPWTRQVDDVSFSAAFPIKASIGYRFPNSIEVGIVGGVYIEPDYFPSPYVGAFCGPQISVIF